MNMFAHEVDDLLQSVVYQGGERWSFSIMDPAGSVGYPDIMIQCVWVVDDAHRPWEEVELRMLKPLLIPSTPDSVMKQVWMIIDELERHERLEQLKVNGHVVWAPHIEDPVYGWPVGQYGPHGKADVS